MEHLTITMKMSVPSSTTMQGRHWMLSLRREGLLYPRQGQLAVRSSGRHSYRRAKMGGLASVDEAQSGLKRPHLHRLKANQESRKAPSEITTRRSLAAFLSKSLSEYPI